MPTQVQSKLPVKIETTTSQAPPNDSLKEFTPGDLRGKLVYIAYVSVQKPTPHWQHFLVLREATGNAKSVGSTTTQQVKVSGEAFEPQFSPDGERVLFKVGNPYEIYGSYKLFVWDIKSSSIQSGPPENLAYRKVS